MLTNKPVSQRGLKSACVATAPTIIGISRAKQVQPGNVPYLIDKFAFRGKEKDPDDDL